VIQRLPLHTPDTDVSISLDFHTDTFVSCSTVRLSSDELSAHRSAASRLGEGYEYESFPSFTLTVGSNGEYEIEGDKQDFFEEFVASANAVEESKAYSVTVTDDSTVAVLPPLDEDRCR
jgi:hypothetical protein